MAKLDLAVGDPVWRPTMSGNWEHGEVVALTGRRTVLVKSYAGVYGHSRRQLIRREE